MDKLRNEAVSSNLRYKRTLTHAKENISSQRHSESNTSHHHSTHSLGTDSADRPDSDTLRQARTNYYTRPAAERAKNSKPASSEDREHMAQERPARSDAKREESNTHRRHHTRRTPSHVKEASREESDAEYVYRSTDRNNEEKGKSKMRTRESKEPSSGPLRRRKAASTGEAHKSAKKEPKTKPSSRQAQRNSSPGRRVSSDETRPIHKVSRSKTMYESRSQKVRSPVLRSKTTKSPVTRDVKKTATTPGTSNAKSDDEKKHDRNAGIFSLLFRAPPPPPPEKRVQCLTCLSDDIPASRTAKLACGHRMCHSCLKRLFRMSITDPQLMPPKCCTKDHIPLRHVEKLFDDKFKMKWNKKYHEYMTKNRIYCPTRGCGEWIRPENIHVDTSSGASGGRKYGRCSRCRTKVCCLCNNKWHGNKACPKDDATRKFIETAKKEGWQRCFNCSAMVELKEGCNHMTCRCTAEFCMICGAKWKTCDCPWFNYENVEPDGIRNVNIPEVRHRLAEDDVRANPPRAYHDELGRRRRQEARDEAYARRLQAYGVDNEDDDEQNADGFGNGVLGFGNAAGHFLNQNFVRRATGIVTGNFGNAQEAVDRIAQETRDNDANLLRPPSILQQLVDAQDLATSPPGRARSHRREGSRHGTDGDAADTPSHGRMSFLARLAGLS